MARDTVSAVADNPQVDYAHLPGEEHNPLMESTAHVDWSIVLLNACRHVQATSPHLVTGNVPFVPPDGGPHLAPDVMVIPGAAGRSFGRYEVGPGSPVPLACVEIVSPSNTRAVLERRTRRLLAAGIPEVYILHPIRETVMRVELVDDQPVERSAVGEPSVGLGLTFVVSNGHLAVCCPADRVVRPGDDPFGWLASEMRRADRAELHADLSAERAAAAEHRARLAESQAATQADRLADQSARLADQSARLADQSARLADQSARLADQARRLAAMERDIARLREPSAAAAREAGDEAESGPATSERADRHPATATPPAGKPAAADQTLGTRPSDDFRPG